MQSGLPQWLMDLSLLVWQLAAPWQSRNSTTILYHPYIVSKHRPQSATCHMNGYLEILNICSTSSVNSQHNSSLEHTNKYYTDSIPLTLQPTMYTWTRKSKHIKLITKQLQLFTIQRSSHWLLLKPVATSSFLTMAPTFPNNDINCKNTMKYQQCNN